MRIQALLPDILDRPTGGNLFNRHMLAFLDDVADVERRVVTGDAPLTASTDAGPSDVTLVDSLLLASVSKRPDEMFGRQLLIAHYLHLFEPGRRESPEARRESRLLPNLDGVITTSEFCRELLLELGFSDRQLATVTPGLAPAYRRDAEPRPPTARPRILTVATVLPGKGLRQFLKALESLSDLDWTWELAGDPGLEADFGAEFSRRVARSPVAGRIRLHGAVAPERMVELYDRCHIFALPSRFETCSMATMEAMSRALPVVAFRVGGLPERVPAASSHLLADPGDHRQLADHLRRLLVDPEQAIVLGRENHLMSQNFPSWEASGKALWKFLTTPS